jgi:hypothetical protein
VAGGVCDDARNDKTGLLQLAELTIRQVYCQTEWSAADSRLWYNLERSRRSQSVVGLYLSSKLKCRSHDETRRQEGA